MDIDIFLKDKRKAKNTIRDLMKSDVVYLDKSDLCWYGHFYISDGFLFGIEPSDPYKDSHSESFFIDFKSHLDIKMLFELARLLGHEFDCDPDELPEDYWDDLGSDDREIISDMVGIFADGLYFYSTFFEKDIEEMYEEICKEIKEIL